MKPRILATMTPTSWPLVSLPAAAATEAVGEGVVGVAGNVVVIDGDIDGDVTGFVLDGKLVEIEDDEEDTDVRREEEEEEGIAVVNDEGIAVGVIEGEDVVEVAAGEVKPP